MQKNPLPCVIGIFTASGSPGCRGRAPPPHPLSLAAAILLIFPTFSLFAFQKSTPWGAGNLVKMCLFTLLLSFVSMSKLLRPQEMFAILDDRPKNESSPKKCKWQMVLKQDGWHSTRFCIDTILIIHNSSWKRLEKSTSEANGAKNKFKNWVLAAWNSAGFGSLCLILLRV